jgi:Uncharacterized conserved protein (COG2071)
MNLKHHPFPVLATLERVVAVSFAFPESVLRPLVPSGLAIDTYEGLGFVTVAMVWTRDLRPAGFPAWLGQDFFLAGYRAFTRLRDDTGRSLRGRGGQWGRVFTFYISPRPMLSTPPKCIIFRRDPISSPMTRTRTRTRDLNPHRSPAPEARKMIDPGVSPGFPGPRAGAPAGRQNSYFTTTPTGQTRCDGTGDATGGPRPC